MKKQASLLQARLLGVARAHFWYVGFISLSIIIFDTTHLVTRESVQKRWASAVTLLVVTTLVWYFVRRNTKTESFYRMLTYGLIAADIIFASYFIYLDRGMASRNVMLFAIPLVVSALLNSRAALFATAALCTAGYFFASTKYFYDFFNEGYKAELYGVLFLYSACFFVVAGVLWAIIRYQKLS